MPLACNDLTTLDAVPAKDRDRAYGAVLSELHGPRLDGIAIAGTYGLQLSQLSSRAAPADELQQLSAASSSASTIRKSVV